MKNPRAPDHLRTDGRALYRRIAGEYAITDAGGVAVLIQACEALDRLRDAQQIIKRDGPEVRDRFGQQRPHPMLAVEKDCRAAYMAALKQLNLDLEPLRDIGRPGGR